MPEPNSDFVDDELLQKIQAKSEQLDAFEAQFFDDSDEFNRLNRRDETELNKIDRKSRQWLAFLGTVVVFGFIQGGFIAIASSGVDFTNHPIGQEGQGFVALAAAFSFFIAIVGTYLQFIKDRQRFEARAKSLATDPQDPSLQAEPNRGDAIKTSIRSAYLFSLIMLLGWWVYLYSFGVIKGLAMIVLLPWLWGTWTGHQSFQEFYPDRPVQFTLKSLMIAIFALGLILAILVSDISV